MKTKKDVELNKLEQMSAIIAAGLLANSSPEVIPAAFNLKNTAFTAVEVAGFILEEIKKQKKENL